MTKKSHNLKNIDFKNKNIIITGASRGIGFETAKEFLKLGASISICSKNFKNLDYAVKKLTKFKSENQKIIFQVVDLTKEKKIIQFIKHSIKSFKQIHVLVNNAGIYGPKGQSENINLKDWKKTFDINFFGSVIFSKYLVKHFKKKIMEK